MESYEVANPSASESLDTLSLRNEIDGMFEEVIGDEGELDLSILTEITDKQAESISKHEWNVNLSNLKSITDRQAEILSKHKWGLRLWLETITDKQAEFLSKHTWWYLWLMDLKSITDKQAEFLIGEANVSYLETITDRQAELFLKEWNIFLASLKRITDRQAEILSKCDGDLDMFGVELTDKQMDILSRHKWNFLSFWSDQTLTEAWAEYLSKYKWKLYLWFDRITSMNQLSLLLEHEWDLELSNLDSLTDEQFRFLLNLIKEGKYKYNLNITMENVTDSQLKILYESWLLKSWFRFGEYYSNIIIRAWMTEKQKDIYNWCLNS